MNLAHAIFDFSLQVCLQRALRVGRDDLSIIAPADAARDIALREAKP